MAKDSYWFKHESNASRDIKMRKLKAIHGHAGVGIFWELMEVLREQNNYAWESDENAIQLLGKLVEVEAEKFSAFIIDCKKIGLLTLKGKHLYSEKLCRVMGVWEQKKKSSEAGGEANRIRIKSRKVSRNQAEGIAETGAEPIAEGIANKRREEKSIEEKKREEKKETSEEVTAGAVALKEKVVKKIPESLHHKMIESYLDFCEFTINVPRPAMILNKEKELPALKRIREYLVHACGGDEEKALRGWVFILAKENWSRLEPFLQKQTTLIQISTNIQNILAQYRNGIQKSTGASGNRAYDSAEVNRLLGLTDAS